MFLPVDDEDLAALYLSAKEEGKPRSTSDHSEAELLLEGVLRRLDETVVGAELLSQRISTAERILELGMAATRNSLLLLEIKVDIVMLAITIPNVVFACYGMNLVSGLEKSDFAFNMTVAASSLVALGELFDDTTMMSADSYSSQW